jgi:hypothetical protein
MPSWQRLDATKRNCYWLGVNSSSPARYLPTISRMMLLIVVPSSAAFFLKAVWVSLDTRIMMFLSFLIMASVYI